jgi:diguanylate cyclase (GGDEF)-like protein
VVEADRSTSTPEELAAELTALEDRIFWDLDATLAIGAAIERAATALGETTLMMRARLVQANMMMRQGIHLAAAVREMGAVNRWAAQHDFRPLHARSHLLLSATYHFLGDPGACLEHAVRAVELLDESASEHSQVWYRLKLADALASIGSADAARERYQHAEQLAVQFGQSRLHMATLNNLAYAEYMAGEPQRAWAAAERLQEVTAGYGFRLDPHDLDTIGRIQVENGYFADAEQTMRTGIARHSEGHHEDASLLASSLLTLAAAQRGQGNTELAQATLDQSRALCDERSLTGVRVRLEEEQAELHAARGDYAAAFATQKAFFADYKQLHSLQREAQARTRQALFETAEAREEAKRFREQARRDPLTELWNRRYVDEHLPPLIAAAASSGEPLTVALVDLDHFKRINDTHSHDVGDQVLQAVARLLEAELAGIAPQAFAARMGGEEFLFAIPGMSQAAATVHLDALRVALRSHPWDAVTHGLPVTVSIGVATTDGSRVTTQSELLSAADRNLYAAKRLGRDRVVAGSTPATARRRHRDALPPDGHPADTHQPARRA